MRVLTKESCRSMQHTSGGRKYNEYGKKAVFLQKATKTGWNEINVLLDVNFYSELFQQEKTFRYFVED